jgi:Domain of unknown function (DUF4214)
MKSLKIIVAIALISGFQSLQAAGSIGDGDGTGPAAAAETASAGDNPAVFVNRLFLDLYGRDATPSELALSVDALREGTARAQVAARLFESPEFHDHAAFLVKLYHSLLKHDPEFTQWAQIFQVLHDGATQDDAVAAFMNTPEYAGAYPRSLGDAAMMSRLYQQMFDHAPDPGQLNSLTSQLAQGATRRDVVEGLLHNAEFEQHIAGRVNATLVYLAFLRRAGSPTEIARVMESFQTGATMVDVIGSILLLPEFTARF